MEILPGKRLINPIFLRLIVLWGLPVLASASDELPISAHRWPALRVIVRAGSRRSGVPVHYIVAVQARRLARERLAGAVGLGRPEVHAARTILRM